MEVERDQFLGCGHYERSRHRKGYRNGYRRRYLETTYGSLRIRLPRVRESEVPFRPRTIAAYQRRSAQVDEMLTKWVACGMSTRDASRILKKTFGAFVSPGTISRIVAELDAELRAFHSRPLRPRYRFVYSDGKHCYLSHLRKRRGYGRTARQNAPIVFTPNS
jgi:transposase-like protein